MRKIFCDICGKEIDPCNETWRQQLQANGGNPRIHLTKVWAKSVKDVPRKFIVVCR